MKWQNNDLAHCYMTICGFNAHRKICQNVHILIVEHDEAREVEEHTSTPFLGH